MKNIHPTYHTNAKVRCGCGQEVTISSTVASMDVEICSHCHPFYTGAKRVVDSAGRVERFKARLKKTAQMQKTTPKKS